MLRFFLLLTCFFGAWTLLACRRAGGPLPPAADLVVRNAKIVTMDGENPIAQAMAVRGETIVFLGSDQAVERFIEQGVTTVIEAGSRLVVPGFNDAHIHFRGSEFTNLNFRAVSDVAKIQTMVAERLKHLKPGEVVYGRGWNQENFPGKGWPTKEALDAVAPGNPVVLERVDGHSVWVNSLALRLSGITADTASPPGGEIVKDPLTGEPTGILKESACDLLKVGSDGTLTPEERSEREDREMELALRHAASVGVTSIQHLSLQQEVFERFRDRGQLTVRVTFCGELPEKEADLEQYKALRKRFPREDNRLRFGYLKGYMDGTLGSATALLFEPYSDAPGKTGLPQMPYDEMERRIIAADRAGFQVGIHAIGPKAVHWVLNAYEKAREANGTRDTRHRIEHAQILRGSDISRFAPLGVVASMQPTHCISDKRVAEKRLGRERCGEGAYVWRKLRDAGVRIAFGTDFNVEPMDPLEGLYAAVTRKDRQGEPGPGWFPDQTLSMEEAIELYTVGSAYAEFMEDRKGMLRTGYLADFVVYKEDLFTMRKERILKNQVDYTVVGGKIVYRREG